MYLLHASTILQKLPYVELSPGDDARLRHYLMHVREAIGGPYGIWSELQDSLGGYLLKEDGGIMNYREFCMEIYNDNEYLWFLLTDRLL